MSDTGRLTKGLRPGTRRMLFERDTDVAGELSLISEVDLAHLVMLERQGLLDRTRASALAGRIEGLRADGFAELEAVPRPRGLYLAYEEHLMSVLGAEVGGALHTGRSRNDLNATTTAMRLRGRWLGLAAEGIRLNTVLLSKARAHRDTVMPVYTHFQPAVPITYGHYLLGISEALGRDVDALLQAGAGLDRCALGAGAVGGTDLPIDPEITADLLGFEHAARHSVDAVASRDTVLRLLGAAAGLAITLSRLGTDLQLWSTAEFGLVDMPDHLVGGSSAMPQKRNAFLLEHLKAKAGGVIGAWTAAASTISSTPFTNSIEVGTEAVSACGPGLAAVSEAVRLAQVLVSGARPVPDRMRERGEEGFTTATAVANHLVREGVAFRAAHHAVGSAVREALERGERTLEHVVVDGTEHPVPDHLSSPLLAARATAFGGGPGAFDALFTTAHDDLRDRARSRENAAARIEAARDRLLLAVRDLRSTRAPAAPTALLGV